MSEKDYYPMKNKKVLITGIEGFVGNNFFQVFQELCPSAQVYGLGRSFRQRKGFTAVSCDLNNEEQTRKIILGVQPDYIFHLAGVVCSDDWDELFEGNVKTTISLLESIKEVGISKPKIVIIGSAAEYGYVLPDFLPVKENAPLNPLSKYGASMCSRTAVAMAYKNAGLDIIVARVFNALGPGLSEHFSIGSFSKQIATIEKKGKESTISTGRLDPKRDFVDIADVARALYLLSLHGKFGEIIYNVCSGKSWSIGDILHILLKGSSQHIQIITDPLKIRQIDVLDIYGSCRKIREDTGWQPMISIEESLTRTLNYHRGLLKANQQELTE